MHNITSTYYYYCSIGLLLLVPHITTLYISSQYHTAYCYCILQSTTQYYIMHYTYNIHSTLILSTPQYYTAVHERCVQLKWGTVLEYFTVLWVLHVLWVLVLQCFHFLLQLHLRWLSSSPGLFCSTGGSEGQTVLLWLECGLINRLVVYQPLKSPGCLWMSHLCYLLLLSSGVAPPPVYLFMTSSCGGVVPPAVSCAGDEQQVNGGPVQPVHCCSELITLLLSLHWHSALLTQYF